MLARTCKLTLMGLFLTCICSCESPSNPGDEVEYLDPIPSVHLYPAWLGSDMIALEDKGAIGAGPGWLNVAPSLVGVVVYSLDSKDFELLIPGGRKPRSNLARDCIVGMTSELFGDLFMWHGGALNLIEETEVWERRSDICASDDRSLVAWRSFSADHKVGVWVFSLKTDAYRYLGNDSPCEWAPNSHSLLIAVPNENDGGPPSIVEYNYDTNSEEQVWTLPEGMGGREYCYSPDGDSIGFIGFSLDRKYSGLYIYERKTKEVRQINSRVGGGLSWGERGIAYESVCFIGDSSDCGVIWLYNPITGVDAPLTEKFQFTRDVQAGGS